VVCSRAATALHVSRGGADDFDVFGGLWLSRVGAYWRFGS
jgi:hypothetical protein